jgi:osmotically-inducible protein OsmY
MTITTFGETDVRLRDAVVRQLDWDPEVDATAIGVAASDGIVTLTGYAESYSGKLAAERSVQRVHGVRAVANEIEVWPKLKRTDDDIARDAAHALRLRHTVPGGVQALANQGCVTLIGEVNWLFQKLDAEKAVRHVHGVCGVVNHIRIAPRAAERDVRHRIVEALRRNADVDARHVTVTVAGDTATLTGTVSTWLQRTTAERAAADAPGIQHIENQLVVEPSYALGRDVTDEIC